MLSTISPFSPSRARARCAFLSYPFLSCPFLSCPFLSSFLAEVEELFSGNYGAPLEVLHDMLSKTPVSRPDAQAALGRFDIYDQYGVGW